MTNETELAPCPFCGEQQSRYSADFMEMRHKENCFLANIVTTNPATVEQWNTRPTSAPNSELEAEAMETMDKIHKLLNPVELVGDFDDDEDEMDKRYPLPSRGAINQAEKLILSAFRTPSCVGLEEIVNKAFDAEIAKYTGHRRSDDDIRCAMRQVRNAIIRALPKDSDQSDALREALMPSDETKAAYMGEFQFNIEMADEDGNSIWEPYFVPWTTIKEIMAAILARGEKAQALATISKEHPNE